jgi:hypothetical protein
MTFTDLPTGAAVFVDANTLVYHFSRHPQLGPACTALLEMAPRPAPARGPVAGAPAAPHPAPAGPPVAADPSRPGTSRGKALR